MRYAYGLAAQQMADCSLETRHQRAVEGASTREPISHRSALQKQGKIKTPLDEQKGRSLLADLCYEKYERKSLG